MNAYTEVKSYGITIAPSVFKKIRRLDNSLQKRIGQRIDELAWIPTEGDSANKITNKIAQM